MKSLALEIAVGCLIVGLWSNDAIAARQGNECPQRSDTTVADSLEKYYGEPPKPVLKTANERQLAAFIGTEWIRGRAPTGVANVCTDAFALVTPSSPLAVDFSEALVLELPIQLAPSVLICHLIPVASANAIDTIGGVIRWNIAEQFFRRPPIYLPLRWIQRLDYPLAPGTWFLWLSAGWQNLGTIQCGFYIEVKRHA